MKNVIAISGLSGSGKSYLSTRIQEYASKLNINIYRIPFAGTIKLLSYYIFGIYFNKDIHFMQYGNKTIFAQLYFINTFTEYLKDLYFIKHNVLFRSDITVHDMYYDTYGDLLDIGTFKDLVYYILNFSLDNLITFKNNIEGYKDKLNHIPETISKMIFSCNKIPDENSYLQQRISELYHIYKMYYLKPDECELYTRKFLQFFATEIIRDNINSIVWSATSYNVINNLDDGLYIIEDMRFLDEIFMVKYIYPFIVDTVTTISLYTENDKPQYNHRSETEVVKLRQFTDYNIFNDYKPETIEEYVQHLFNDILVY